MARTPDICWEDLVPGTTRELGSVTTTAEAMIAFAQQFDPQSFHVDEKAGQESIFGGLCASGWFTCSVAMRLLVDNLFKYSSYMGSPGTESIKWLKPVYPGDTLSLRFTVLDSRPLRRRSDVGMVHATYDLFNQEGAKVLEVENYIMLGRRHPGPPPAEQAG
ncbi:MAG: MaoC family dehydratase [Ramlibacter sp.]|nr:MaoC family dehydratase [Ramlibacter sp.]MBX3660565.1 MaoC family dehydratase [Ramlibacter sp.]MCW5651867.1 MaoC family dehydratase [Ramlibacter sp.]